MLHIIISEERRDEPERKAIAINNDLRTPDGVDAKGMPKYVVTPRPPQLHSMTKLLTEFEQENILYAAEWDQVSPWIVVHKGAIADLKMAYMGWPMITKEEYDSTQP